MTLTIIQHRGKFIRSGGQKVCTGKCGRCLPYEDFYTRTGYGSRRNPAVEDGHFNSECVHCMIQRNTRKTIKSPWCSSVTSTQMAIDYLMSKGIWAQVGNRSGAPGANVVAWGAVWIDVKYDRMKSTMHRSNCFNFTTTPTQRKVGFQAHLVMLICEYAKQFRTHHLFFSNAPFFYKEDGTMKTGVTYTPDKLRRAPVGNRGYQPLTEQVMMEAKDDLAKIDIWRSWIAEDLRYGERPAFGEAFAL